MRFFAITEFLIHIDQSSWYGKTRKQHFTFVQFIFYLFDEWLRQNFIGINTQDPIIICFCYTILLLFTIPFKRAGINNAIKLLADFNGSICTPAIYNNYFITPPKLRKSLFDDLHLIISYNNSTHFWRM